MTIDLTPGSTFAGHRIDALAGHGGMGVVYRATDLTLDRPVALKLIAPALAGDPAFRTRFESECRIAAAIDHPHSVQVFRAGEEAQRLFVTMPFIEGTDLGTVIGAEGKLEPRRAVELTAQVAGALDEAHRRGLVHRDVKPANVLLARRGGREHAFLTDFGLSQPMRAKTRVTNPGFVMGTADYMAPEHARGADADGRADVYALACVLFHSLAGVVPYDRGSDLEKLLAHLHEPPPSLLALRPELPPALEEVLHRALAKEPDDRHGSAGELARDARAALDGTFGGLGLRVVVAEDSVLLRAGVVHVLQDAGFDVVAEVGDGEALLRAVRDQRPNVAVTDIRMPPTHTDEGLRAARVIRSELRGTGVLVLSQYAEEAYAAELLEDGGAGVGYLLKDRVADPENFADAVRQVGHGGAAFDPEVVAPMVRRERTAGLSAHDREILARVAEGRSNAAIAEALDLGEAAVAEQVAALFARLDLPHGGAGPRRALALLARLHG